MLLVCTPNVAATIRCGLLAAYTVVDVLPASDTQH